MHEPQAHSSEQKQQKPFEKFHLTVHALQPLSRTSPDLRNQNSASFEGHSGDLEAPVPVCTTAFRKGCANCSLSCQQSAKPCPHRPEVQALFEGCTVLTSPCHQEDILGWNVTLVETLPGILSVLLLSE